MEFKYGMSKNFCIDVDIYKNTLYIPVVSLNDNTRAPYRKPAPVSQSSTVHLVSFDLQ